MAALATMTMGDLNEERKQVYPLFQKGASTDIIFCVIIPQF